MAVTLKTTPEHGHNLLKLFGVSPHLIETAQLCGITVVGISPGLYAVCFGDKSYGNVAIKGSAVTMAAAGQLGPASKQSIQYSLEEKLKLAIADAVGEKMGVTPAKSSNWVEDDVVPKAGIAEVLAQANKEGQKGVKVSLTAPLFNASAKLLAKELAANLEAGELQGVTSGSTHSKPAGGSVPSPAEKTPDLAAYSPAAGDLFFPAYLAPSKKELVSLMGKAAGPLTGESVCGAPVHGTSSGSVYYVMTILTGAAIAARLSGHKLSIRVEPTVPGGLGQYSAALLSLGFDDKGGHYSTHLSVNSKDLLQKTVGAILFRIGLENVKKTMDPVKLLEVGALA